MLESVALMLHEQLSQDHLLNTHRFCRLLPHQSTIRYSLKWQLNLPAYSSSTSNKCTDALAWASTVKKMQSLLPTAAPHACASSMRHSPFSFALLTFIKDQISMVKKHPECHKWFCPSIVSCSYWFADNDESGL